MKKCVTLALVILMAFSIALSGGIANAAEVEGAFECALEYKTRVKTDLYLLDEEDGGPGDKDDLTILDDELVYVVDVTEDGYAKILHEGEYRYVKIHGLSYSRGEWYTVGATEGTEVYDKPEGTVIGTFENEAVISAVPDDEDEEDEEDDWCEVVLSDGRVVYVLSKDVKPIDFGLSHLPAAIVDQEYSARFKVRNLKDDSRFFFISNLPDGIRADHDGEITGTPTATGEHYISVTLKSDSAFIGARRLLAVYEELTIVTEALPDATVGTKYTGTIEVTGGDGKYTFTFGDLPGWLKADDSKPGAIAGTPDTAGTHTFTVKVKDESGNATTKEIKLAVVEAPLTLDTFHVDMDEGKTKTLDLLEGTQGGLSPYTFDIVSGAPQGVSLSGSVITFDRVQVGVYTIGIRVTDALKNTADSAIYLAVSVASPTPGDGQPNTN